MKNWDGKERRSTNMQMNQDDRDRFIRMDENLKSLIEITEHYRKEFKDHVEQDNSRFAVVFRFLWGFAGAGGLILFFINVVKVFK